MNPILKQLTINPSNKLYYSEDFIKGFECGTQRQLEADKADIPTWIPCSERLPSEWEHVLVYTDITYKSPFEIAWIVKGRWASTTSKVLAWMPLPEPWKGADDDTN